MRNSRLDRILYIQQVLVQGGVLNKQQTADRFGVSEKTIQRDLDTLRNHFADSEPRSCTARRNERLPRQWTSLFWPVRRWTG